MSLDAKGMTTGDIVAHLEQVYDTSISRDTGSEVTPKVAEDLKSWQTGPLDASPRCWMLPHFSRR